MQVPNSPTERDGEFLIQNAKHNGLCFGTHTIANGVCAMSSKISIDPNLSPPLPFPWLITRLSLRIRSCQKSIIIIRYPWKISFIELFLAMALMSFSLQIWTSIQKLIEISQCFMVYEWNTHHLNFFEISQIYECKIIIFNLEGNRKTELRCFLRKHQFQDVISRSRSIGILWMFWLGKWVSEDHAHQIFRPNGEIWSKRYASHNEVRLQKELGTMKYSLANAYLATRVAFKFSWAFVSSWWWQVAIFFQVCLLPKKILIIFSSKILGKMNSFYRWLRPSMI